MDYTFGQKDVQEAVKMSNKTSLGKDYKRLEQKNTCLWPHAESSVTTTV